MRKLAVFNSVTLDGYFVDAKGDMSWAHKNDPEWNAFVPDNAKGESVLVFGRITYEMMASWWPTPEAIKSMPAVAVGGTKAHRKCRLWGVEGRDRQDDRRYGDRIAAVWSHGSVAVPGIG